MKRFRWTRTKYREAAHLARFFARFVYNLPEEKPALLERYFELWQRHPQGMDPLTQPLPWRLAKYSDDIPF